MYQKKKDGSVEILVPYEKAQEKDIVTALPPGIYYPSVGGGMMTPPFTMFQLPSNANAERIVEFTDGVPRKIIEHCNKFFTPKCKDIYDKLGVAHKLGVLLYGGPGTGKTTIANIISKNLIENNGAIVLDMAKTRLDNLSKILGDLRSTNPDNIVVVMCDEFECDVRHHEEYILKILDGNLSYSNFLFLATTNYISRIPNRIKKRPSRFKMVEEIDCMPAQVYRDIIIDKLSKFRDNAGLDVAELVHKSVESKCTIDELKHIVVELVTTEQSFEEALSIVRVSIHEEAEVNF